MFVVAILIFSNCICGPALSTIVEAQQLSHGRTNRQASNSDTQTQNAEMNIAFDLPDITAAFELPSGSSLQLEGFKHVNNDKLMAEKKTSQLSWVSIGHPHFIRTKDPRIPNDMKFFHSTNIGFTTYVQMMTEKQKATLATAARNKYQVDIADDQVKHMVLAKFDCNILLYDEAGNRYLLSGKVSDVRHFPLRLDFDIPPGKIERILFSKSINEYEDDLRFECHIESSGGKIIKSNTLSISYEQSQQIGLEEKLFGPTGSDGPNEVYVTRNQMTELAHEMYSTLNIIEEYQMPETQFSEAFVNDFISQLASSQFNQVPIDTVLASISKYSFDFGADLRPDIIKKDIGSFLTVNNTGEKSRIVLDEKKYNEWVNTNKVSTSASAGVPGLFEASLSAAVDISRSGATNDQTLNDQMRELNTLAQKEAKWEIEGEKIVPKSLNVARIMRANMKKSLTFRRIRIQQFHAPFERNFNLYTSRASQLLCQNISTTKGRYEEMLESMSHNVLYLKNASRDFRFQSQIIDSIKMDLMSQSQKLGSIQRDSSIQSQKLGSIEKQLTGKVITDIVSPEVNLALGRPATQSSTYEDQVNGVCDAGRAVDGNYDNEFYVPPFSCSHTNDSPGGPNWWRVQLDRPYHVQKVIVTNRKDCCESRSDYFIVGVTNSKEDPVRGTYTLCGQYPSTAGVGATMTVYCDPNIGAGQYVIIQQPINGAGQLTLCEVEVYARPVKNFCPSGFDYIPEINQCLYLNLELMTWDNARTACTRVKTGAEMVSIKDSAKQEAVKRYLEHQFATKEESSVCILSKWTAGGKISWLGGQTRDPNQCGTPYFWKPVGTAETSFAYTNWHPGMPNCAGSHENCAIIPSGFEFNYRWEDIQCEVLVCSMCEF